MTTTPETPAIASKPPADARWCGQTPRAPSALDDGCTSRSARLGLPTRRANVAGLSRSTHVRSVSRRVVLLATVDRSERDAITQGSPEHGDGIDLGW